MIISFPFLMKVFFFSSTSRTQPSLSIFKPLWVLPPSQGFGCRLWVVTYQHYQILKLNVPEDDAIDALLGNSLEGLTDWQCLKWSSHMIALMWHEGPEEIQSNLGRARFNSYYAKKLPLSFFKQYCLCPHLGFKDRFHFYLFVSWAHHELWSDLKKFK